MGPERSVTPLLLAEGRGMADNHGVTGRIMMWTLDSGTEAS